MWLCRMPDLECRFGEGVEVVFLGITPSSLAQIACQIAQKDPSMWESLLDMLSMITSEN